MVYYILPGLQLESECTFASFAPFASDALGERPRCTLKLCDAPPPAEEPLYRIEHKDLCVERLADSWLYRPVGLNDYALQVSPEYQQLTAYIPAEKPETERLVPLLRTALECASIASGVLSLHSACVEWNGEGICFTAPSGTGKSTRAMSWQDGFGARMLSGDRPSICVQTDGATVSGAPWDGKEQIFVNRTVPLRAICSIRRGEKTYLRKLSPAQAKRILCQQCFLPMWDTETAAAAMQQIQKLCEIVPIYRVTCGPDAEAAAQVRDILFYHPEKIEEIQKDMKIKKGFVLRNIAGEHVVMPTGKNISRFDGTIVLNEVAAFVWEQLSESCSREELLQAILSEFDVDRTQAEMDLDALLEKLRGYQVIEEAV